MQQLDVQETAFSSNKCITCVLSCNFTAEAVWPLWCVLLACACLVNVVATGVEDYTMPVCSVDGVLTAKA